MVIFAPRLHRELGPAGLPAGIVFFNPGLVHEGEGFFKPTDLPLDAARAKRVLADLAGFGEQFRKPSDLAYFAAQGMDDHYTGTSKDMRSEFADLARLEQTDFESGGAAPAEPEIDAAALLQRSQTALLLAWTLEERVLEMSNLQNGLDRDWNSLTASLGEGDEDGEIPVDSVPRVPVAGQAAEEAGRAIPWEYVLEHLAAFLPEDAALYMDTPEVRERCETLGITPAPVGAGELAALGLDVDEVSGMVKASAKAYQWLGLTGAPRGRVWLAKTITVLLGAAHG